MKFCISVQFEMLKYPFYSWPSYEYTSDHISNLNAHCKSILQTLGLRESSQTQMYEERIFLDVFVYLVYASAKEKTYLLETLKEKGTSETFYKTNLEKQIAWNEIHEQYRPSEIFGGKLREPVFFLTSHSGPFKGRSIFQKLDVKDPRFHFLIVKSEDTPSPDFSVSLDERALSLHYVNDKRIFSTIDNLLEEYSFQTVRCKARYLNYLRDMQNADKKIQRRSNVTDLERFGLVAIDSKSKLRYTLQTIEY